MSNRWFVVQVGDKYVGLNYNLVDRGPKVRFFLSPRSAALGVRLEVEDFMRSGEYLDTIVIRAVDDEEAKKIEAADNGV